MKRRICLKAAMSLVAVALAVFSRLPLENTSLWAQQRSSEKSKKKSSQGSKLKPSQEKKPEPEVHWPKDITRLQGLEVDHVPLLEVLSPESKEESLGLVIRVGRQLHHMTQAHHLQWIQVWVDDLKACEIILQPGNLIPRWQLSLHRRASMQITVKTQCNLHGIWANRVVL